MNPKHPVYIISKGRWESRHTAKALESLRVPYHIVVEPQERDEYAKVIDPAKILVLPWSNHAQRHVPARNWCWEHAISQGATWHWCLDDNIKDFWRSNYNIRVKVADGTIFRCAEDFAERYDNVAVAGMNYYMFYPDKHKYPAYFLNSRVYSCFLIRNDIPFRFRGSWNDDTDFSLRILKAGMCTILFNAFLAQKLTTMTVKGGLADEYKDKQRDVRLESTNALLEMHPDVVQKIFRWGRWHHYVDWTQFRNKLKLRDGYVRPEGNNEYGMSLKKIKNERTKKKRTDSSLEPQPF